MAVWILGIFYVPGGFHTAFHEDHQMLRFIYVPVLLWLAQGARTQYLVGCAFVGIMALSVVLGVVQHYGLLDLPLRYSSGSIFKNHIATSFFVSIAAYLSAYHYIRVSQYRKQALGLTALFVFFLLFVCMGRTGLVTLITLFLLLGWQYKRFKGFFAAVCVVAVVTGAMSVLSETLKERWQFLGNQTSAVQQKEDISIQLRKEFAVESWNIFKQKPLLGYGTGSFGIVYKEQVQDKPIITDDPHQEYLRFMVEHGVLGLLALFAFFALQWFRPHPEKRELCQALALVYAVGCMGNSMLMNFSESHLYILGLALCYAPMRELNK